jgi:hypothetical protein
LRRDSDAGEGGEELVDGRAGIGSCRREDLRDGAVGGDDHVGPELTDVFMAPLQPPAGAQQLPVFAQRPERPHLSMGTTLDTKRPVQLAVDVGDDGERHAEVLDVCAEVRRVSKCHDGDLCSTEFFEALAHGEHVLLARQSSKMSVQDEHEWYVSAAVFVGLPPLLARSGEFELREFVTN